MNLRFGSVRIRLGAPVLPLQLNSARWYRPKKDQVTLATKPYPWRWGLVGDPYNVEFHSSAAGMRKVKSFWGISVGLQFFGLMICEPLTDNTFEKRQKQVE